ncbi:DUF4158 domain-containing protein [Microtetraspora glauca]|uniref:DUF4158 domain-containing protein n=1 Tax=Microtetraspora glauca TaxID=1996 RepID=A0ABV3GRH4_MICGL
MDPHSRDREFRSSRAGVRRIPREGEIAPTCLGRGGRTATPGFALRPVTVRWLRTFLEDPLDVPGAVLEFVAEQLEVEDPSHPTPPLPGYASAMARPWSSSLAARPKVA